jgi:hypothetical protein
MEKIYNYKDYKKYLQFRIGDLRGESSKLAAAAACEKSYLSRVLSTEAHITPDHAFRMTEYWQLNPDEQEYFLLLVDDARSGDPKLRKHLQRKMNLIKKQNEDLKNIAERPLLEENAEEIWYNSSWLHCAAHMVTAIPHQSTIKIAQRFHVPPEIVESVMLRLQKMGYVDKKRDHWIYAKGEAHLSRYSPLVAFHHTNWRNRALSDLLDLKSDAIHFSNVQTLSFEDFERLKQMILSFIHEANQLLGPSESEDLICFNLDYFRV